jgi:predicted heme/steroid binding protein
MIILKNLAHRILRFRVFLVGVIILLLSVSSLFATEELAEVTSRDCAFCHLDPSGGGELTSAGEGYALFLGGGESTAGADIEKSRVSELFRFIVGYLHILFGVFWFGTILYVHLILKPAYASRGLPRGEVKLGLLSIVVMGVTGAILFAYRVPDTSILLTTRFGILLLVKIALYLIMVCSALFAVFFLGPRLRRKRLQGETTDDGSMTLEQLAQFDGKDGRKAYFAYQGEIFDATDSPLWKNGSHMGRHQAGCDLTEVLGQAPHNEDKVTAMTKVGALIVAANQKMSPPQKVFYTMAYMNLGFVLMIILILACWRWW